MKTVALTGATGFVGRFALRLFLDAGWKVQALARKPQERLENVIWVVGNLSDRDALRKLAGGADCLAHVAGAIFARNTRSFVETNVEGTANVIAAAQQAGVSRIVHVSSLAARKPEISTYASTKAMAEALCAGLANGVIVRPCAVYGEGDTATLPLIRELLKAKALIPGRTSSRFSMIHAEDVGRIIVALAESSQTGIAEISDGEGAHDWAELAAITRRHFGTPSSLNYAPKAAALAVALASELASAISGGAPKATRGSINQLYEDDWVVDDNASPLRRHIGLEEGLLRTIAGYRRNGQLAQMTIQSSRGEDKGKDV